MMILPETRELARLLLASEAVAGEPRDLLEAPTLRVYEKLRQRIGTIAGVAAFQSLAFRALALARRDDPTLDTARVTSDGRLQGLDEFESQIDMDKDRADENLTGGGGVILISRLLGLFLIFLGESLTLSLLRDAWPGATLDNCDAEKGRKA